MGNIEVQIKQELQKIREKYLNSADEINSDYNRENDISDDYKGRQIFELLQNAEDEAEEGKGKVLIEYKDNIFSISNTGKPFSFGGVKSLLRANNSPKKTRQNMIGNKGLGFRSTLNWAKKISILTQEFGLEFSKENAKGYLLGLFNEKPQLKEELKLLNKDEYPIAILACPKIIDKKPINGFVTTIRIECKNSCDDDITNQINALDLNELLFLKGLNEVTIVTEDINKTFSKSIQGGYVYINEYDNSKKLPISSSKWQLFPRNGSITYEDEKTQKQVKKDYEMVIAYDSTDKTSSDYLYSFFKTKIPLKFPGIIHATFELTTDRNYLKPENEINKKLIGILTDFIIETAVKISKQYKQCNYEPLKLVFNEENSEPLEAYGFYDSLKEKVKDKQIFPTIKNEYIYLKDNPKYSRSRFDEILNKDSFFDLLQNCDDSVIENYLLSQLNFYDSGDFSERLNKDIENNLYSLEDKCKLIKLLHYEHSIEKNKLNLLVDTNGNNVTNNEKVYVKPSNEQIIQLPKCVDSVRFLNAKMQNILLENGTLQTLSDNYKDFGILPYRFNTVIENVLKFLNKNLTEENVAQLLNWLFNFYKSNKNEDDVNLKIQEYEIPVICRNGIRNANESYFGIEFGNEIGEKIISIFSENFLKNNMLGTSENNNQELIKFYEWLGVSKYPRIQNVSIERKKISEYLDYCFFISKELKTNWGENINKNELPFYKVNTLQLDVVESFEEILVNAPFDDILCWFLSDEDLHTHIKNAFEINDDSCMECLPGQKKDERRIYNNYLAAYIRLIISKTEWVETSQGKTIPKYCCLDELNLEPKMFVPKVNYEYIKKKCGASKLQINSLLQELGIQNQFLDLPIDTQYEILLSLPEIDKDKKLSRKFYMLVKNHDVEDIKNSENYKKFLQNGKVLAKYKGDKVFVPVSEAFYVDKKIFSEELLKQFKIFDIEHRVGAEKVKNLFGVKQINNIDVEFDRCNIADENISLEFENDYRKFIPYVLACRKTTKSFKTDLSRLKRTYVKLVTNLTFYALLTDSKERFSLNDFETIFFQKRNTAYIKISSCFHSLQDLKQNINFSDAVAEIITAILDVNDDKNFYRELFEGNNAKRDFLLRNDKGDENLELLKSVRTELKYEENKKLNFWSTLANIKKLYIKDDENENEIIQDLGIPSELANSINYENINESNNAGFIREIFSKLEIKLSEYNDKTVDTINLKPYWISEFCNIRNQYFDRFKFYLYLQCKDSDDAIDNFEERKKHYYIFTPEAEIKNDINIDLSEIFENTYGISLNDLNKITCKDLNAIIEENKKKYGEDEIQKKTNLFGQDKVNLHILFNSLDALKITEIPKNESIIISQNEINESAKRMAENIDIQNVNIQKTELFENRNWDRQFGTNHSRTTYDRKTEITKETIGMAGELAVYKKLKEKYPDIQWLSGNAQNYKHITKGDDSLGYDMTYINESGQNIYVEVKASANEHIVFDISKNEINFALKHSNNYYIYFVHLENNNAHIKELGTIFKFEEGEDLFTNKKFTIDTENYKISANSIEIN